MTVVLSEKEVTEAVREWCEKRFPMADKQTMTWKAINLGTVSGETKYRLEFTVSGVEIPPKEGPYR